MNHTLVNYLLAIMPPSSRLFMSPGRINIIGEHTDYNNGFVLPACIDKAIYFAVVENDSYTIEVESLDMNESLSFDSQNPPPLTKNHWKDCVIGVCIEFLKRGITPRGMKLKFKADLPIGAGLSSSSALCCGLAFLMDAITQSRLNKMAIAKIARDTERNAIGINCGFMDQFIITHGIKDRAILLDCNDLSHTTIKLPQWPYQFLLINSNVPHSLHNSEYNTRRKECESVVTKLSTTDHKLNSLRDIDHELLESHKSKLTNTEYYRAKYVIDENIGVHAMQKALENADAELCGQLLTESHWGLSEDYEVSCEETDFIVSRLEKIKGVMGARMIGGGFGGCVLVLAHQDAIEEAYRQVSAAYFAAFRIRTDLIRFSIEDGVQEITL